MTLSESSKFRLTNFRNIRIFQSTIIWVAAEQLRKMIIV